MYNAFCDICTIVVEKCFLGSSNIFLSLSFPRIVHKTPLCFRATDTHIFHRHLTTPALSTPALSTPATWCRIVHSCNVHPCHIVLICPLLQIPSLQYGAELSTPALSTPANSAFPFRPLIFLGPVRSGAVFRRTLSSTQQLNSAARMRRIKLNPNNTLNHALNVSEFVENLTTCIFVFLLV